VTTFLRPNTIAVDRRARGSVSPTGEPALSSTSIVTLVPARIDVVSISGRMGGQYQFEVEGDIFTATHILFLDGLEPRIFGSTPPGDTFEYQPPGASGLLPYIVAPNGRAAFIDLEKGDRVTDEGGATYLALAIARYYDVNVQLQAQITQGRAWSG
jgi:hypothetical protein